MATCTKIKLVQLSCRAGEKAEYVETYAVLFDGPTRPEYARLAVDPDGRYIPRLGTRYRIRIPRDPICYVDEIRIQAESDDHSKYRVEVTYQPPKPGKEKDKREEKPEPDDKEFKLPPTTIKWSFNDYQEPVIRDLKDPPTPIANSAGQLFDPPPTGTFCDQSLTITTARKTHNHRLDRRFKRAVNEQVFLGDDPGTWMVEDIQADLQREETESWSTKFWSITFTLLYREKGWFLDALDHGNVEVEDGEPHPGMGSYWETSTGTANASKPKKAVLDSQGQPMKDVLLDGRGKRLAEGEAPVQLKFKIYHKRNFAELDLPIGDISFR